MIRQIDVNLLELPASIITLAETFTVFGLQLILVGGATRDFFLKGEKPRDYDFEVRSLTKLPPGENWINYLHQVIEALKDLDYSYEKLPFEVYRLSHKKFGVVEIASARVEEYSGGIDLGAFGHSDFRSTPIAFIDDALAFRRRDFTINAIGIDLMTGMVHDPFGGLEHIKQKILHPCFDHFFNDPVRLLRLIRFELQLEFSPSPFLANNLARFNLLKCSSFYIEQEANKSNPLLFYKRLFDLPQVRVPKFLKELKSVIKIPQDYSGYEKIKDSWDLFYFLLLRNYFNGDTDHFCLVMGEVFNFPQKKMGQAIQQKNDLEEIKKLKKEYFRNLFKSGAISFCGDIRVFALTRLLASLDRDNFKSKLEQFSPDCLILIDWLFHLGANFKFEKELGEKYLPENKNLWRNLTTYLLFLPTEQ